MRFAITWVYEEDTGIGQYKVSVPNYGGGDVVSADEVEKIERALKAAQDSVAAREKMILPLFRMAQELQFNLEKLVKENPGKDCVKLFVETILDRNKGLHAAIGHLSKELGNPAVKLDPTVEMGTVKFALARMAEGREAQKALADAAMMINCAGPVVHRIHVLKENHREHVEALEAELKEVKDTAAQNWDSRNRVIEQMEPRLEKALKERDEHVKVLDALRHELRLIRTAD